MVKLEEVQDEEFTRQKPTFGAEKDSFEDDDEWEGTDDESDFSDDSEVSERGLAIQEETIWERISALRDIIPPSTRRSIAETYHTAAAYTFFGGKLAGNLAWIFTTSALLVGLPFALAVEDESRIVAQEKEMLSQQQGQQMMLPPGATSVTPGQQQPGQASAQGLRPPGF
ncbi:mitochondrial import translocase, subunit Tom22 [Violaceomyces palustris]|uniref:Mitochondrial import translocase, subunit Tom22 n=1 Tax=Violaceomyces palustris TaxID=1673888 RepID=A0ACD0NLM2_9BASI|nr:mitochondrial import translocase, subunit Tom22 [Violaceomyces palustris]